jgi:ATP-dependent DNA ligase
MRPPVLLDMPLDRGLGLEGLIGKRSGSQYEAGKRTGAWVKIKLHQEQEFVIGGYSEPKGARKHFGGLLVAFTKARNPNLAGGLEPASAKRFCVLSFLS